MAHPRRGPYSFQGRPGFRRSHRRRALPSYRACAADGAAWITGASSGIGRALALRLAADGFQVAATARRADRLHDLAQAGGGRIFAFPGDVTDVAAMRAIVAAIEARIAPLALAVLNAGIYDAAERGPFDAEVAWRTVAVNLGGAFACIDPVLAAMRARGRGQVALTASLVGYGGVPGSAAYGASKAALINLAEALRLAHARDGICVQVINPGFVATAMTAGHDYPMPFVLSAEAASDRIRRGLASGGFEIAFPRRLSWAMKAAALLPYPPWLALMAKATRRALADPRLEPRD